MPLCTFDNEMEQEICVLSKQEENIEEKLIKSFDTSDLSEDYKPKFKELLISHKNVFSTKNKVTHLMEHTIEVVDDPLLPETSSDV